MFADVPFGNVQRSSWIDAAADTILAEGGGFPHHLTNGCCALAELALTEGIGNVPPTDKLSAKCRRHKREYYDARLHPWADHMSALAYAFGEERDGWTRVDDVKRAVMAADEYGESVEAKAATGVIRELCAHGYVEVRQGACRPVLPSLASHFHEVRGASPPDNEVVQAVQAALSGRGDQRE